MFSIVIPLYNKELSIGNTIQSVLNQTFTDFELVVVNDGSNDSSLQVVKNIRDSRIRIINKPNGGVSSARNCGIGEARREWIAFLDGDDLWEKNHLETAAKMIGFYRENQVFCTSFIRSNQPMPLVRDNSIMVIEDYFVEAIKKHFFWTSVAIINKEVFEKVGVFKEFLSRGEDLELWTRIGAMYRFVRSNEITASYVQESENKLSFSKFKLEESFIYHINFSNRSKTAKKYLAKLLRNRLKSSILKLDIRFIFVILWKYRFNIFYR